MGPSHAPINVAAAVGEMGTAMARGEYCGFLPLELLLLFRIGSCTMFMFSFCFMCSWLCSVTSSCQAAFPATTPSCDSSICPPTFTWKQSCEDAELCGGCPECALYTTTTIGPSANTTFPCYRDVCQPHSWKEHCEAHARACSGCPQCDSHAQTAATITTTTAPR